MSLHTVNICFRGFFLSSRHAFMLCIGPVKSFLEQDNIEIWIIGMRIRKVFSQQKLCYTFFKLSLTKEKRNELRHGIRSNRQGQERADTRKKYFGITNLVNKNQY